MKMKFLYSLFTATGLLLVSTMGRAEVFNSLFSEYGKNNLKGDTIVTADSMDMDMKNNIVTLVGNVMIEDPSNKLTADKIDLFLDEPSKDQQEQDTSKKNDASKFSQGGKEAKNIVATGNVVILRKSITPEEKAQGDRKAIAGRADYNLKTGMIVLSDHPVIYRGKDFIRGKTITLWRDNDRVRIEGDQSSGQVSKLVLSADNTITPELQGDTSGKSGQAADTSSIKQ